MGWPVLMAMTVIAANVLGAATGEWQRRESPGPLLLVGRLAPCGRVYVVALAAPASNPPEDFNNFNEGVDRRS